MRGREVLQLSVQAALPIKASVQSTTEETIYLLPGIGISTCTDIQQKHYCANISIDLTLKIRYLAEYEEINVGFNTMNFFCQFITLNY